MLCAGLFAQGKAPAQLRVGAAKVDVTPAESERPKNYEGILDHLYSRAIVIDDGTTEAALITVDIGGMNDQLWHSLTKRIESELGIPGKQIMLTATHSHSAPRMSGPAFEGNFERAIGVSSSTLMPPPTSAC